MRLPTRPVSDFYGYDRGTPVDRHYIDQFLTAHAGRITGDAAEIKDDTYLRRFGGATITSTAITSTTVIDIDPANPHATLIADLTTPGSIPPSSFDCLVCTQTLQLLTDPAAALANCRHALRPGGTLLLTAPTVGRLSYSTPDADLWRITPAGLQHLFTGWNGPVTVTAHGNLRTCLAMLIGEAAEDLTPAELNQHDPGYPLLACAIAHRSTAT